MKRRDLMRLAPVALAAGAVSASAAVVEESSIAVLHREIIRRNKFLKGDHGLSDDEFEAFNMETAELADKILDLRASNADEMLRKIMGHTINGEHDLSESNATKRVFDEARALIGGTA